MPQLFLGLWVSAIVLCKSDLLPISILQMMMMVMAKVETMAEQSGSEMGTTTFVLLNMRTGNNQESAQQQCKRVTSHNPKPD